jgi:hypothetical protein
MKLVRELHELPRGAFESLIVLTFNADLPWFERRLLGPLQTRGVRRILLLADERPLSSTLWTQRELIGQAGHAYAVEGLRASVSFHPKLLLLTGEARARLYVGSGNLSRGGMERNRELFERWDVEPEDKRIPEVFDDALEILKRIVEQHFPGMPPAHVTDSLNAALGAASLMRPREPNPGVKLRLGGLGETLSTHLERPPTPAHTLRMSAPYFDAEGSQAVEIARQLRAADFTVITDLRMTNLNSEALGAIREAGGRLEVIDPEEERRVHAKLLHAAGEGWQLAIHGSSNLSNAAWHNHNVELLVFRKGTAAAEVAQCFEELPTRKPSESEIKALGTPAEKGDEPMMEDTPRPPGPRIASAHWFGDQVILRTEARHGPGLQVEFAQGDSQRVVKPGLHEDGLIAVVPERMSPEHLLVARLLEKEEPGPWCVVHDPRELHHQAQGRSPHDQELVDHLSANPDDPKAAEELLRFYIDLLHERVQEAARRQAVDGKPPPERSPSKPQNDIVIRDEDFQGGATPRPSSQAGRAPMGLESPRLLMRLLFGGVQHEDADAREAEGDSPGEDVPGEPDPPSEGGSRAAARIKPPERDLTETVMRARAAYLQMLGTPALDRRGPVRLLQDAQALCTGFQRAFRTGQISIEVFVAEQTRLLRALLGRATAPLPQALREVPESQREELWTRAPFLPGVLLLVYNVCLADLMLGSDRTVDPSFPSAAPVLWIRHILRHAPHHSLTNLLALAQRQLPRLQRHDALWLGDTLRSAQARVSFGAFLERMVREIQLVEHLEGRLRSTRLTRVPALTEDQGEVLILTFGQDGTLAPGFAQFEDMNEGGRRASPHTRPLEKKKRGPPRACLFEGAFLSMASHLKQAVREPMREQTSTNFVSFDTVLDALGEDPEVFEALGVLERIVNG